MYDSDDEDTPGGDDFVEVTSLFRDAAEGLPDGTVILTDGFTLLDSMSAIEIGEPRMDSGVILEEETKRPPFKPLDPLLPSELCYILDRTFACEMEWHTGTTLTQTIYTFLYIYHYDELDPEILPYIPLDQRDPARPMELVTLVLRSAVAGFMKCCDMVWRELNKGKVFDTEDWQSEKGGGSLMEGLPVRRALAQLDDACTWISDQTSHGLSWKEPLLHRMELRNILLELFSLDPTLDRLRYQRHLAQARHHLHEIRYRPSPPAPSSSSSPSDPSSESPALHAFDPYITRRLNSYMPLKVLELPEMEETWKRVERLLDGLEEVCEMVGVGNLMTWKIVGNIHARTRPTSQPQTPYLRSLIQSVYFDDFRILGALPPRWAVDCFFVERLGVSYDTIVDVLARRWVGGAGMPLKDLEGKLIRLLTKRIQIAWYNPPRRRRALCNSLLDWHVVYDLLQHMSLCVTTTDTADLTLLLLLPKLALLWRLETILDVILSGFELDLYVADERPFAYWYALRTVEAALEIVGELREVVIEGSVALSELEFQARYLEGLRDLCRGMFVLTLPQLSYTPERMHLNLLKRYKWAFLPQYGVITAKPVGHPDLRAFLDACAGVLADETYNPSAAFKSAHETLLKLGGEGDDETGSRGGSGSGSDSGSGSGADTGTGVSEGSVFGGIGVGVGWAGRWSDERMKFVQTLATTASRLSEIAPSTLEELAAFNHSASLVWNKTKPCWFPDPSESVQPQA
ncbi:Mak10-domain-containing protein [Stereum hirsutum FP-91666 SS1]|uniref:Mak10-domain-containing protein n=1 Tax=Stereum hirsutum (strain FP-91666) TaxID=721885 RepID=UPI00044493DA|nr:Mak10-domain-containing protein [Stereum hirsutum FP-91666 SS1]EIM82360.1 Mak10-domain-containing protein [Stereum hirsutum FP-91666 SS1]